MAAEKWMLQTKRADFQEIAEKFHINPVTARIMRNRDVVERRPSAATYPEASGICTIPAF